jgi:hypothetical protein
MTFPICWNRARVREVFTTESRQKARELFLETHRPFHRIHVDFCKEGDLAGTFVDEGVVREIVQRGDLAADNRLFFVVGEAGSGKSELCQWLEYAADRTRSLPIHLPRSMTNAAAVAVALRRALGAAGAPLTQTPLVRQAEHVALSAVLRLYERGREPLLPAARWESLLLSEVLRAHLVSYLQGAVRNQRGSEPLVDEVFLETLCAQHGVELTTGEARAVVQALDHLLREVMDGAVSIGDLRALLQALSEHAVARGQRPLLLIEDITAFQAMQDLLLDYLLDLSSGHFDAVIGVTRGFERTQLVQATIEEDLTHIHHRLRARFLLSDEGGRSYGLEENLVELARSYLRAVKPTCDGCPAQARCDDHFGEGLYPFTETVLRRAFDHLEEEGNPRQTPRLFLEHVLGAVLLSDELPPLTLDRSPYLKRPPLLCRSSEIEEPALISLLRWYSEVTEEVVSLDAHLAALWGITVPPSLLDGTRVRAPRTYVASPPEPDRGQEHWQQELRELQQWLAHGGLYPSRETLKRGIEQILLGLGDPRSLRSPHSLALAGAELYYARGDERLPIFLAHNSGDQPGGAKTLKAHVAPVPEARQVLEELLYLALSGASPAQVCGNVAVTLDWAQAHWNGFQAEIRAALQAHLGGITAEQVILVGWRLLATLCGRPWGSTPHIASWEADAVPYAAVSPWSPAQHRACYSAGEAVSVWHETLRRLFIGSFTLRDTLLDWQRYHETLDGLEIDHVMERLATLQVEPLRTLPIKVRPSGTSLYEVLRPLQRYAQALCQLDVRAALEADLADLMRRERHLAAQVDLDLEQLRGQLATLHFRSGEIGLTWQEPWEEALGVLRELEPATLSTLLAEVRILQRQAQEVSDGSVDLWSYQAFRHAARPVIGHPYWEAREILETIQGRLRQMAARHYRSDSRTLSGTSAYHGLLQTVRSIKEQVRDG